MSVAHLTWYTERAAGYTALLLLTASVVMGLVLSLRVATPRWPRFLTNQLHEFVVVLTLVFAALHGLALLVDPFERFRLAELLVPFTSHYATVGTALGTVGLYVLLAVWISSRLRRRIGYALWRKLHALAFLAYGLAVFHTLLAGEDAHGGWGAAVVAASVLSVGCVAGLRLLGVAPGARERPVAALATTAAAAFVATLIVAGPYHLV